MRPDLPRLRLTLAARHDLRSIHRYSEEMFGLKQADAYGAGLARAFRRIAEYPAAVRLRTETARPVRASPYKSHVILYALEEDDVLILRIRHAGEDWIDDVQDSSPVEDDQ